MGQFRVSNSSGDQIQITGVLGNTTANTLAYVSVLTSTTFSLYSDTSLSVPIAGSGAYTSGGVATKAQDISGLSGDFTLRLNINGVTASKNAVVCVQDSADGFVSDIVTLWCVNPSGGSTAGWYVPPVGYSVRGYQLPSLRIGVTSARLRLFVTKLDSGATVTTSLYVEK